MKFTQKTHAQGKEILANDHYVAVPFSFADFSGLAVDGVVKAGTIFPSNDKNAQGINLYDVILAENPNGALVIHGFIVGTKLPAAPTSEAMAALTQIKFIGEN